MGQRQTRESKGGIREQFRKLRSFSSSSSSSSPAIEERVVDLHLAARMMSGRSTEFVLPSSATFWQLLTSIQNGLGQAAHRQKLVLKGEVVHASYHSELKEVGIRSGDIFDVIMLECPPTPEDISPRGLRRMLLNEGVSAELLDDKSPQDMICMLERNGWTRCHQYANGSKHEDIEGLPIEFCQAMKGKIAVDCTLASQFFGGHFLKFFCPLEVPDALKFIDERSGNCGLRTTHFILTLADGARFVHVCPRRYQPAESDDRAALESFGLAEVRYSRYSPPLTRGDTWWMLPRDRPSDEAMEEDRRRQLRPNQA